MSRMAIPTMDVVRFKEDDVIVASIGPRVLQLPQSSRSLVLSGMNDKVSNNASILCDGETILVQHLESDMLFRYRGKTVNAQFLHVNDKKNLDKNPNKADIIEFVDGIDGTFELNFVDDMWTWVHQ